ncbi:MAG: hypothetical protein CVU38_18670 [Chloroflexi bacterium HGW-Chloroflexi-1]|nr:MAG: hypothetical protein CVU38_18670 [Chloroflexi bacterium HGW-Chloroflexi-1]
MDYARASATELIASLREQERHPDLKLIQALLQRGNAVVTDLIEVVEDDTSWPQIHAALLLCELRAESALPAIQQAISDPEGHDLADWLVDDALEKFGPAALDMLEAVAADRAVEWYQRAVACQVMMTVAYRYAETYARVTASLRSLLPDPTLDWRAYESYEALKEAVDDPQVWTSVVARLCDLRDLEAYDLIGQLFEAGLVDEMMIDPPAYQQAYQRSGQPVGFEDQPTPLVYRYKRNRPREGQR